MGPIRLQTALCTIWAVVCVQPALLGAQNAPTTTFEGIWCGVADETPDAGLPVTVRLKARGAADSLRIALSLPESRLFDLAIPSPYSDSAAASFLRMPMKCARSAPTSRSSSRSCSMALAISLIRAALPFGVSVSA